MSTRQTRPVIVIIVGPTGVGKTRLAIELAEDLGGEIISADSMQVYRYMDIGTAKPTVEERSLIRHHLVDVIDPDEAFNAALFVRESKKIIENLSRENKNIFVVGGTGLYVKVLLGGIFEGPGADHTLRDFYRYMHDRYGQAYLYDLLKNKDSLAAERVHTNDTVRIIRALEVLESTGESIIMMQREHDFSDNLYEYKIIGLNTDKELLYEKIDERVENMIADGLVEEVKTLLEMGYGESLKPMQSMCYRHIVNLIRGRYDEDEAIRLVKRDTRHYAKRQLTWFRRNRDISWFDPEDKIAIREGVKKFFEKRQTSFF
jgi:tRNA dimethylallyltransferase